MKFNCISFVSEINYCYLITLSKGEEKKTGREEERKRGSERERAVTHSATFHGGIKG